MSIPSFRDPAFQFSVGDAVYALSNSYVPYNEYEGTYAEYAVRILLAASSSRYYYSD